MFLPLCYWEAFGVLLEYEIIRLSPMSRRIQGNEEKERLLRKFNGQPVHSNGRNGV